MQYLDLWGNLLTLNPLNVPFPHLFLNMPTALKKESCLALGRTPHPVIVAIRETKVYIRDLLESYDTTMTGWGSS